MIQKNKVEAVFIDRDGTIGGDDTIHYPGHFECFPFSRPCLEQLKAEGIKVFSFTNQPGIGMLVIAAAKHLLNLGNCIVIGDRWSDMVAAKQANCLKILVKTGPGHSTLLEYQKKN